MLIRPATTADVPAVLPMVAQICALHQAWDAAKYGFLPDPEQRYRGWLARQVSDRRSVFLVAEVAAQSGQLVLGGFLIATTEAEVPIYRIQEYGFIHDLWVEPAHRRSGIARQMVERAIEQFHQIGVQQIRLEVAADNDAARQLFRACGFRLSATEMLTELEHP